ncbi:MAG: hypothetical protein HKK66_09255 [Chlorobiaceae bacterium]|nr:hypothetical protein [Chlorobiaceae bacterium]
MYSTKNKNPEPPGVVIWVMVTLLWGTVFFYTSVFMLRFATVLLGQGVFNPSRSVQFHVYGIHAVVLVVFALAAMLVKNMAEPGGQKQIQRWKSISEGKGEKLFISFAGSIATSFFFTGLTALTFLFSAGNLGFSVSLTYPVVLTAALFNIGAGLAASLIVGFVFLIAKVGRKKA